MNINIFKKNPAEPNAKKKSLGREWLDAGVFAVVVATLIRTFILEAYTIPTGSMEGSLLINDFLFVSKMHYGARIPNTPLSFPFVHNEMPGGLGKSYSEAVKWPYKRLPGFSKVARYDDVVFNYPEGDTIIKEFPGASYYDINRVNPAMAAQNTIDVRPIDKTDNYIKRCVGLPGDKIQVKEGRLYVNDEKAPAFKFLQSSYLVKLKPGQSIDYADLEQFDIRHEDYNNDIFERGAGMFEIMTNAESIEKIKKLPAVDSVVEYLYPANVSMGVQEECFPHDAQYRFNRDNFGPIVLPKKGDVVQINSVTLPLYRRLIQVYEGHQLQVKDSTILIDGKPATNYTIQGNYYWMMGDNRHNSLDSRFWGYVPETHIVGKAWFVWMSYEGSLAHIRWSRLFHGIKSLEK